MSTSEHQRILTSKHKKEEMKMIKYRTAKENGLIVKIVIDSVKRFWKATTNDFEFYDKFLADLDWKPKEEAQADLDCATIRTLDKNVGENHDRIKELEADNKSKQAFLEARESKIRELEATSKKLHAALNTAFHALLDWKD